MVWDSNTKWSVSVALGLATIGFVAINYALGKRVRKRTKYFQLMDVFFKRNNVIISNPMLVEHKLTNLIKGGKNKLQIITDFDRTLSRHHLNGKICSSCHGVIESSSDLDENYKKKALELRNTYYPLEMSHELTREEKRPIMIEWWTKAHNLLIKAGLKRSSIPEMVSTSNASLREGVDLLLYILHANHVPVLILSAGVGDILEEIIRQQAQFYDNVKVASNYMEFDQEDNLVGFKGELIHTFNKSECAVHQAAYFNQISSRNNVILLGDTIGDLNMSDGVPGLENILTVGFLNDKIDERLPEFNKKYDIVLIDDGTMEVPNAILKKIL